MLRANLRGSVVSTSTEPLNLNPSTIQYEFLLSGFLWLFSLLLDVNECSYFYFLAINNGEAQAPEMVLVPWRGLRNRLGGPPALVNWGLFGGAALFGPTSSSINRSPRPWCQRRPSWRGDIVPQQPHPTLPLTSTAEAFTLFLLAHAPFSPNIALPRWSPENRLCACVVEWLHASTAGGKVRLLLVWWFYSPVYECLLELCQFSLYSTFLSFSFLTCRVVSSSKWKLT